MKIIINIHTYNVATIANKHNAYHVPQNLGVLSVLGAGLCTIQLVVVTQSENQHVLQQYMSAYGCLQRKNIIASEATKNVKMEAVDVNEERIENDRKKNTNQLLQEFGDSILWIFLLAIQRKSTEQLSVISVCMFALWNCAIDQGFANMSALNSQQIHEHQLRL